CARDLSRISTQLSESQLMLEVCMRRWLMWMAMVAFSLPVFAQDRSDWLASLPKQKDYVQKRASSYDRSGGNFDLRRLAADRSSLRCGHSSTRVFAHNLFVWAGWQASPSGPERKLAAKKQPSPSTSASDACTPPA